MNKYTSIINLRLCLLPSQSCTPSSSLSLASRRLDKLAHRDSQNVGGAIGSDKVKIVRRQERVTMGSFDLPVLRVRP